MIQKSYPPKDGGWGWFVVLGAAIFAFLTRGFSQAFSLIFEEIRHKFGTSASSTGWVYSVMVTTSLFAGPVSTMLCTRFSVRKTGLFGSCLLCIGFLASAFAPSLIYIYLAFAMAGFGQGLISTPSLIMIGEWFDKRRARATSFSSMPAGLGMLTLGPLLQYLLFNYSYSGTMLIVSAIMAHHIVGCALFRQPDKLDYVNEPDEDAKVNNSGNLHTDEKDNIDEEQPNTSSDREVGKGDSIAMMEISSDSKSSNRAIETKDSEEESLTIKQRMVDDDAESMNTEVKKEMIPNRSLNQEDVTHLDEIDNVQKTCSGEIIKYFDYRLFSMGHFLTFCLSFMSASLCFSMINTHIAGLAIEVGLDTTQLTVLFTLLGSFSILSKFLSGFLFDISAVRKVRVHVFVGFGIIIGGCLLASPFVHNIVGFYIIWILYISAVAVFYTQESVVLADLVGREKFASALGIIRFFRGLGVLIGPTFGGFLKDYTEVYDYTFIFGGLCFLSTVSLFEISVIIVNRKNKVQAL